MAVCCSVLHCNKLRMSTWFPTKANYYTTQEKCIFCSSPSLTARTRSWSACNLSASSSQGNMRWASQKNEHSSLVSRWWRRSCSRHDERRRYSERNARWHDGTQSCQCPCFSPYWVYTHTHNCTCCSLILHQTDTMGQRVIYLLQLDTAPDWYNGSTRHFTFCWDYRSSPEVTLRPKTSQKVK